MAHVAAYKKDIVEDIVKLIRQYNVIGLVNMSDMPAPQLQSMRKEMRGKVELFMTKKRLIKLAIEKAANDKKGIEGLEAYFEGMPALLFANENPFKLNKFLQKSRASAPAKAGQIAPNDITVSKGPTPFAPGPIISELSSAGLKVGIEAGKVAIKEDAIVAKKGEKIKPKVAEILTRLGIKPMQVGLGLVAAYENGVIYLRDVLDIDEKLFGEKINLAAVQAFNLAFNIAYPTKGNIQLLIAKAFNDAKALGVGCEIFDEGIVEILMGKAEMQMLALKNSADIQAIERPKEDAKEDTKEPAVEKQEEKILEEEKKIIKEEKKLEQEKPKESPIEREVQKAVKEEEEKELENERIDKEEELEKVENQKEKAKKAESKKEKEEIKPKAYTENDANKVINGIREDKEQKAQKEVEDLAKELLKKGTLRK